MEPVWHWVVGFLRRLRIVALLHRSRTSTQFSFLFFFKTGLPAVKTDRERHGASETRPTINHPTTDKEEEERNGPMNTTRNKKGRQQQQTKT